MSCKGQGLGADFVEVADICECCTYVSFQRETVNFVTQVVEILSDGS